MSTHRLPPDVIKKWGQLKHDFVPAIKKLSGPTITPEFRKELAKKVDTLFATFDGGLRDRMKKASTTKNDADAKKAMQEVVAISNDYLTKLKVARQSWGKDSASVADIIQRNLQNINDSAKRTLAAMK